MICSFCQGSGKSNGFTCVTVMAGSFYIWAGKLKSCRPQWPFRIISSGNSALPTKSKYDSTHEESVFTVNSNRSHLSLPYTEQLGQMSSNPAVGIPGLCRTAHKAWQSPKLGTLPVLDTTNGQETGLAVSLPGAEVTPTLTPHCPDLLGAQQLPGAPSSTLGIHFSGPLDGPIFHLGFCVRKDSNFPCSLSRHNISLKLKVRALTSYFQKYTLI